jgi:hypothetical protein
MELKCLHVFILLCLGVIIFNLVEIGITTHRYNVALVDQDHFHQANEIQWHFEQRDFLCSEFNSRT